MIVFIFKKKTQPYQELEITVRVEAAVVTLRWLFNRKSLKALRSWNFSEKPFI